MEVSSPATANLQEAFLELRPELARRARAMGAGEDADDVLQNVWLRASRIDSAVADPRAYLRHMLYTAVLDWRRSQKRAAARDGAWATAQRHMSDSDASPAEAERALIARDTLAVVEARLTALGDPAQSIFRRHRIGGESQRSIAADLGMGLSTVEKHLRRAYAAILGLRDDHEA